MLLDKLWGTKRFYFIATRRPIETSIFSQIFNESKNLQEKVFILSFHMTCVDTGKSMQDLAYTIVISYG